MTISDEQAKLSEKLMGPVTAIISRHSTDIMPLLNGKPGEMLKNDDAVRKVATFCYALLPGLVRLGVKEPTFVTFVMNNRERLLGSLAARQEAATS